MTSWGTQVIDGLLIGLCISCSLSLWTLLYVLWPLLLPPMRILGATVAVGYTLACFIGWSKGYVRYNSPS